MFFNHPIGANLTLLTSLHYAAGHALLYATGVARCGLPLSCGPGLIVREWEADADNFLGVLVACTQLVSPEASMLASAIPNARPVTMRPTPPTNLLFYPNEGWSDTASNPLNLAIRRVAATTGACPQIVILNDNEHLRAAGLDLRSIISELGACRGLFSTLHVATLPPEVALIA